jgi:transposase
MGHAIGADHSQVFLFPPALEDWVPLNHPARFIREFVADLDLRKLGFVVKPVGDAGANHYSADLLLSVWLYGYFERIRSSRKLEAALKSNLPLIWLSGLHQPDHSSLWRFWAANKAPLRKVFKETVLVADKLEMIDFAMMAVDGTKILASSSRRAMWSEKSLSEKEKAVDEAIAELEEAIGSDTTPCADPSIPVKLAEKQKLRQEIRNKREHLHKEGRKHLHPCEPDARVMKNQRTNDLCYNAQAVADSKSQIVTAAEVTNDENDQGQLVPMIDQVAENLGRAAEETLADSGYATEEQFGLAEKREYSVLTTVRSAPNGQEDRFRADLFHFDPENGTVECPVNGTLLKFERERERHHTGMIIKLFRCRNKECPLRELCSKDKRGKAVEIGPNRAARQNQTERQKLPESKEKIRQRAGIIEPIFALTKVHGGFKRFTFRGLSGAQTQWSVEMAGHNLRKIYQNWRKIGSKKAA